MDDAGVYKISAEIALVQTIDFITPIVNDPYNFGKIAAANSISDVYTMGARPVTAMNVVCFPSDDLDILILREILRGGLDTMNEAGVAMMGGHSVKDAEMKYGLSVTGVVHPDRLITNSGTQIGDDLVLTKPLGTGVLSTALKNRLISDEEFQPVIASMVSLNKTAAEQMLAAGVHACTDITGFGLAGHASHLVQEGEKGIELDFAAIPVFHQVTDFLKKEVAPGGLGRNREFYSPAVRFAKALPDYQKDVVYDPQTSGGLLIALPRARSGQLVKRLRDLGVASAAVIGRIVRDPERKVVIR